MSFTGDETLAAIVGKKLTSVSLDKDKDLVTFSFEDGSAQSFDVVGDCCSTSWIEHLELPGDIAGATIVAVEDGAPITQDHPEHDDERGGQESNQVYNTLVRTDRGDIVLEYRNSSNGYYGGWLSPVVAQ